MVLLLVIFDQVSEQLEFVPLGVPGAGSASISAESRTIAAACSSTISILVFIRCFGEEQLLGESPGNRSSWLSPAKHK